MELRRCQYGNVFPQAMHGSKKSKMTAAGIYHANFGTQRGQWEVSLPIDSHAFASHIGTFWYHLEELDPDLGGAMSEPTGRARFNGWVAFSERK